MTSLPSPSGFLIGVEHVWSLSKGRFGKVSLGLLLIWTTLFSILSKQTGLSDATTHALVGPVFGIATPLALLLYARHLGASGLLTVGKTTALLGVSRQGFATGAVVTAAGCAGIAGALSAILSITVVRDGADPTLARDLITSAWVGFLGGAAYASVFVSLSATHHGWWVFSFFLADWLLGSGTSAWTGLWPRAHLANLLGAEVALPETFAISAGCLWAFCALGIALFAARNRT
ncbi:MAG TPA: hypothetical protein VHO25_23380 [Polyangiaceae bacterium]|nr:hypothetical protein [Polyangiaceae bacterium]